MNEASRNKAVQSDTRTARSCGLNRYLASGITDLNEWH